MTDINEITQRLKAALGQKRYQHSLGVADTAKAMAEAFGADQDRAYLAGLVHDCAKYLTFDESLKLFEKYNRTPDTESVLCPPVLHAPLGAVLAKEVYGITDSDVLSAIARHTVADEGMTLLDKIIYIADMAEPHRDFDGVDEIRKYYMTDIDAAYAVTLRLSLMHNISQGKRVHPNTLKAWNEILLTEEKL